MYRILLMTFLCGAMTCCFSANKDVFYIAQDQFPQDTNIRKINIYNNYSDGDSDLTQIVRYDAFGRLSQYFRMDNTGKKILEKTELKYHGNSNKIISKHNEVFANTFNQYFTALSEYYGYDSLDRLISKYSFDKDTTYIDVEEYQYNSDNKIFKTTLQQMHGAKYVKEIRFYDNLKRLIKKDIYSPGKEVLYSDIYEYEGNKQSHYLKNKQGLMLTEVNEYEGERISKTIKYKQEDGKAVPDFEIQFFYNNKGWLTGEKGNTGGELMTRVSLVYTVN